MLLCHATRGQANTREATLAVYTTVPNALPIAAVATMASAPQKVTRAVARKTFAPPALAPIAPSTPRNINEAADTIGTR